MYDVGKIIKIEIPMVGTIMGINVGAVEVGITEKRTINREGPFNFKSREQATSFKIILKNGTILEGVSTQDYPVRFDYGIDETIFVKTL